MNFRRSIGVLGFVAALVLLPLCRAAEEPAPDALKSKDLVKSGTTFVLSAEKELSDSMRELRKLKAKLDSQAKTRRELEAKLKIYKNGISGLEHQKRQLLDEYSKLTDITQKNNHVAQINAIDSRLQEANATRQDLESQLNTLGAEEKTQFINEVIDLGTKVDKAQEDYKGLADDPDVKDALEKMNQPGKPKMKLGPSAEFTANTLVLKKWRGDVASDTITIKHENDVPSVEVTLNGTVVREMVIDSGASMVCLTADLAAKLNMVPTEKDEDIHFKMADGKEVDAKHMVLKTVRVGQFTVADVDCAVLPASLVAAEPLLGGTFLNNFVFKIDPAAGKMHLAVIAGNSKVTTAGGEKKKTGSTSEK
ncbi:MAG TPA: retroviral-like aspartic protease family protein [Tepidisphaeraceae bacterium]|jgi:aspartyl protease family protein|nr:retroviral-like aspartic protease family protein [Tepidisphaeraceae bacterium]